MKRCSVCATKIRDSAITCPFCGNDDFSKTLPQQLGELENVIEAAHKIITYIAKVDGDIPPAIYAAADKWIEKYNEMTQ